MNNISILHSYIAKGQYLIYIKDLAEIINSKPQTIRKWICKDRLPSGLVKPNKIGNRHVWSIYDVEEYMQSIRNKNLFN